MGKRYEVTAPDGRRFEIEAPDDATEEQVMAYAREHMGQQPVQPVDSSQVALLPFGLSALSRSPRGRAAIQSSQQGATLGFADELKAVIGAAAGAPFSERTFGEIYGDILGRERGALQQSRQNFPGTSLTSEIVGGVATGGMTTPVAKSLLGTTAIGGGLGGLYGAGSSDSGDVQETLSDAARGAALGAGTSALFPLLAKGIGKLGQLATRPNTTSTYQSAVQTLDDAGIPLTTGARTGSHALKTTESTLSDTLLGGSLRGAIDRGRQALQRKIMGMAGFADDATMLTRETLDDAADRFSARYAEALNDVSVNLATDDFIDGLARVEQQHAQLLPVQQKAQVTEIIDQLLDQASQGPITGESYQRIRSSLARNQRANTPFRDLYRSLKHTLDDAFANAAGAEAGAAKRAIDREYARYKALLQTFESNGGALASQGYIPLSSLAGRASRGTDRQFEELARAGSTVFGDVVGKSGTAERTINTMLLSGAPTGAAVALGGLDAGAMTLGAPLAASYLLGKGATGGRALDALSRTGVLAAPAAIPIERRAGLIY